MRLWVSVVRGEPPDIPAKRATQQQAKESKEPMEKKKNALPIESMLQVDHSALLGHYYSIC